MLEATHGTSLSRVSLACVPVDSQERAATVSVLTGAAQHWRDAGVALPMAPVIADGAIIPTVRAALAACAASSSNPPEILLVCGSFYILKDTREALGLCSDAVDAFDLHERMKPVTDADPSAAAGAVTAATSAGPCAAAAPSSSAV